MKRERLSGRLGGHLRRNAYGIAALFIALGGTAWAVNNVGPRDIKRDAVRSKHVKNGQIKRQDLRAGAVDSTRLGGGAVGSAQLAPGAVGGGQLGANAVNGGKVADGSLRGADIDESSLGEVPAADTVDGVNARAFAYNVEAGDGVKRTVFNFGGLEVRASCPSTIGMTLEARTSVDRSWIASYSFGTSLADPGANNEAHDRLFRDFDTVDLLPDGGSGNEGQAGTTRFMRPDGRVVTVNWYLDAIGGTGPDCHFAGTALAG